MIKTSLQIALIVITITLLPGFSAAQQYNFYFGNLHAHSAYSDGNKDSLESLIKTPAACYAFARQSAHLDFLGISEHNHGQAGMKRPNYAEGLKQADIANKNGTFVALYGMEYGVIANGGHVLIYGVDQLIGWEANNYDIFCGKFDYTSLWNIISRTPKAFATLAHPEKNHFNNLFSKPYNREVEKAVCGVAVSTGPAFSKRTSYSERAPMQFASYYRRMLALGYMTGPTIDHDNHQTTFGRHTAARTVVLARALHRDSIMAAYRARRFYASQDWNAKVSFTVNRAPMGSYLKNTEQSFIAVSISDDDPVDQTRSIKIMYGKPGSERTATVLQKNSYLNTLNFRHQLQQGETFYYYLEIIQADGDKIFTAPIWVQR